MKTTRKTSAATRAEAKQASHDRIVDVASRAIRKTGYDGTGVADLMRAAGLTHGGFYAHFDSREAMLAEAADRAGQDTLAAFEQIVQGAPDGKALSRIVEAYLSPEHIRNVEQGCVMAALGSEMSRQAPAVRAVATRRVKEIVELIAWDDRQHSRHKARERAMFATAALVGTLILTRAVDDPEFAAALRDAALRFLPLPD